MYTEAATSSFSEPDYSNPHSNPSYLNIYSIREISGSHSGEYAYYNLLEYSAMYSS
jgi:hypothetical protein